MTTAADLECDTVLVKEIPKWELARARRGGRPYGSHVCSPSGHVREFVAPETGFGQSVEIRDALLSLPAKTRAAVAVHYLVGLSVRETADVLGVSENTIKSQLKTGLARLREVLHDG